MASAKDFTVADLTEHFEYLDTLRASGATNMFGAGSWLANAFALDRKTASNVLSAWMGSYDPNKVAEERAALFKAGDE